jgi:phage tail-like protein
MARARIADYLQVHRFQLLDVSYKLGLPPFVFNPVAGFSSITSPEIEIETEEHPEGNFFFKRHLISGGNVSPITLQKGSTFWDSEFWLWFAATMQGQPGTLIPPVMSGGRRNLLLIQFMGYNVKALTEDNIALGMTFGLVADMLTAFQTDVAAFVPAKAWMLFDCLPTRYKAGGDFDATSAEISLMELEITPDRIEEFGIAA